MALAIPLIIMTVALLVAFGLGTVMARRPLKQQQFAGALGVAALMLAPLGYDAAIYDGNCYGLDGSATPVFARRTIGAKLCLRICLHARPLPVVGTHLHHGDQCQEIPLNGTDR